MGTTRPSALRCVECGEVIKPGRTPGTFTHVTRLVASCDMDSDHRPVPEAQAEGSSSDGGPTTIL